MERTAELGGGGEIGEPEKKMAYVHLDVDRSLDIREQRLPPSNPLPIHQRRPVRLIPRLAVLGQADVAIQPVHGGLVPHQAVLGILHIVVLVREDQQLARDALLLQHVEGADGLGDGQAEVAITVRDEVRRCPLVSAVRRVPARVVIPVGAERALECVAHEGHLVGRIHGQRREDAGVGEERLELAAQVVALDPVGHVAAVAGAQAHGARRVDEGQVRLDVLPPAHEIVVGPAAPLVLDAVREALAEAGRAGRVEGDDDVALLGPGQHVPPDGPGICGRRLRTAVYVEHERVGAEWIGRGGLDDPAVHLVVAGALVEDLRHLVAREAPSGAVVEVRREERDAIGRVARGGRGHLDPGVDGVVEEGRAADEQGVARAPAHARDGALGEQEARGLRRRWIGRQHEETRACKVLGAGVEARAVLAPQDRAGAAVPRAGAVVAGEHLAGAEFVAHVADDEDAVLVGPVGLILHAQEGQRRAGRGECQRGRVAFCGRRVDGQGRGGRRGKARQGDVPRVRLFVYRGKKSTIFGDECETVCADGVAARVSVSMRVRMRVK